MRTKLHELGRGESGYEIIVSLLATVQVFREDVPVVSLSSLKSINSPIRARYRSNAQCSFWANRLYGVAIAIYLFSLRSGDSATIRS